MIDTHRAGPNWPFWATIAAVTTAYLALLLGMLLAMATYSSPHHLVRALGSKEIQYATVLSLVSCTITALLSLLVAVPVGYLMARSHFAGKNLLDTLLDIPIVLPPMVIGLCLLILFQTPLGRAIERFVPFTYTVYGVVLAQFVVGAAFAVRQMRTTFDHLPTRPEDVAMTLGCSRGQAVWLVTLPAAKRGMFSAASVAWARSLGEFGPILVFAGATRMKTEVLPTSVWLELSVGNLEAAIAVSLMMVVLAVFVLLAMRAVGGAAMISLEHIAIDAGAFVLNDVSFTIPTGAYGVLMGPTGCGKTTLLEVICGLRKAAAGRVLVNDRDVTREPPGNRGVGYVPQDGALFPTMTVRQQLAFALRIRRRPYDEIEQRVAELADHLGIAHLLDRKPAGLSGGERQRIALGRALAPRPAVLLLDEPLSALDEAMRGDMRDLLKSIQREHGASVLHVTHDRIEATELADVLLVMANKQIQATDVSSL